MLTSTKKLLTKMVFAIFLMLQVNSCDNVSKAEYEALKAENQKLQITIDDLQKQISARNSSQLANADCPKNLKVSINLPESINGIKHKVKFSIENFDDSLYYHVLQKNSGEADNSWHLQKSGKISSKEGYSDIEFGNKKDGIGETFDVKVIVSKKLVKREQGDQIVSYEVFKDSICKEVDKSTTRNK